MWNDPLALNRLSMLLLLLVLAVAAYAVSAQARSHAGVRDPASLEVRTRRRGHRARHGRAGGEECLPGAFAGRCSPPARRTSRPSRHCHRVRSASVRRRWPGRNRTRRASRAGIAGTARRATTSSACAARFSTRRARQKLAAGLPLLTGPEGSEADVVRVYEGLIERLRVG